MENTKKVLIVDDEPKILDVFSRQLTNLGHFNVETAQGGIAGLDKIKQGGFDVVLLDLMMPDKDGIEVLKEMQSLENAPKVMVLTNLMSEEQEKITKELGVKDYIIKTKVDPKTLIEKINNLFAA